MKRIILVCCSLFLLLIVTGCGNKNSNELVMVTEAGFAPYEYYENGKIVGVDIAISKDIAKAMNKKLVVAFALLMGLFLGILIAIIKEFSKTLDLKSLKNKST